MQKFLLDQIISLLSSLTISKYLPVYDQLREEQLLMLKLKRKRYRENICRKVNETYWYLYLWII